LALGVGDTRVLRDLPGDAHRLVIDARGYKHVLVNGEPILEAGAPTGARPGQVLRSSAPTARGGSGT